MQDDAGFYGPLQYSPLWLWLGTLLLLLVAGWYVFLFWPARMRAGATRSPVLRDVEALRAACLAAIDTVAAEADAGRLPERAAHQRLSVLVREFAGTVTGRPASTMTLEELRAQGLDPFTAGIATMYPAEFSAGSGPSIQDSAAAARQAVQAWN